MRYNVKLFWNYVLYLIMATFIILIPFVYVDFNFQAAAREIDGTMVGIWATTSLFLFVYLIVSIKNEVNWKKIPFSDYLLSIVFGMLQAAFVLVPLVVFTSFSSGGDVAVGSQVAAWFSYYALTFLFGFFFVVFVSLLWFKSTEIENDASENISFAIKKTIPLFFKGWTFMANTKIKYDKEEIQFNLLLTPKNSFLILNLNQSESSKIELGGLDQTKDEDGKEKNTKIKSSETIAEFEKLIIKTEKYINSFYEDNLSEETSSKITLTPVIVYKYDKIKKPLISGDATNKLVVSNKEFIKQVSNAQYGKKDSKFINKNLIIKRIDKERI